MGIVLKIEAQTYLDFFLYGVTAWPIYRGPSEVETKACVPLSDALSDPPECLTVA